MSALDAVGLVDPVPAYAATVPAGAPAPLPQGPALDVDRVVVHGGGRSRSLPETLTAVDATSLVVVAGGQLVHEWYGAGVSAASRLLGASATKSVLAHLVGLAVASGALDLDAPASRYAPELAGHGSVPVRDVLTMTSGVDWVEDHRDPRGPATLLTRAAFEGVGSIRDQLAGLGTVTEPGVRWEYSTADSQVLDLVRERATGVPAADALASLWADLGCESDALLLTDAEGTALAGGGLAATARDWARIGLLQLDGRGTATRAVLDDAWLETTSVPAHPFCRPGRLPVGVASFVGFGGHWWPRDEAGRVVAADGARGQFVHVDRDAGVVVVLTCRWPHDDAWHDRACRDLAYLTLAAVGEAAASSSTNAPTEGNSSP